MGVRQGFQNIDIQLQMRILYQQTSEVRIRVSTSVYPPLNFPQPALWNGQAIFFLV